MGQQPTQNPPKGFTQEAIVKLVNDTITALNKLRSNPDKDRAGGFITVVERESGNTILHAKVGTIPKVDDSEYGSKERKYRVLSTKKAHQLNIFARASGHISGWQNRDEDKDQFGGAVAGNRFIFAFSGLTELGDEAVSLILADVFDVVDCLAVKSVSQNWLWTALQPWWEGYDVLKD